MARVPLRATAADPDRKLLSAFYIVSEAQCDKTTGPRCPLRKIGNQVQTQVQVQVQVSSDSGSSPAKVLA